MNYDYGGIIINDAIQQWLGNGRRADWLRIRSEIFFSDSIFFDWIIRLKQQQRNSSSETNEQGCRQGLYQQQQRQSGWEMESLIDNDDNERFLLVPFPLVRFPLIRSTTAGDQSAAATQQQQTPAVPPCNNIPAEQRRRWGNNSRGSINSDADQNKQQINRIRRKTVRTP